PNHGEYRMLQQHSFLAQQCGVEEENIFIIDNGDVLALEKETARIAGKVNSGSIYVDGSGIGDIGNIVLRDRSILSEEVLICVVINIKMFKIESGPDFISRGFVYMRESEKLINEAQRLVAIHLEKVMLKKTSKWSEIKNEIIDTLAPFLYEKTKRRPMVMPII